MVSSFLPPCQRYPVERIKDNRLRGILQELILAISEEEDPLVLRKIGQSLKMIGDGARTKGWDNGGKYW